MRRSRSGGLTTQMLSGVRGVVDGVITGPVRALARRLTGFLAGDRIAYAPRSDGKPDPGEVVWAWVPYEEDPRHGKDRPVLVVGRRRGDLLALMLTTTDHDPRRDAEQARGRHWMDVGSGAWDRKRRPSEVRLDRLLVLDPAVVRREGAALDRALFLRVVAAARSHQRLR